MHADASMLWHGPISSNRGPSLLLPSAPLCKLSHLQALHVLQLSQFETLEQGALELGRASMFPRFHSMHGCSQGPTRRRLDQCILSVLCVNVIVCLTGLIRWFWNPPQQPASVLGLTLCTAAPRQPSERALHRGSESPSNLGVFDDYSWDHQGSCASAAGSAAGFKEMAAIISLPRLCVYYVSKSKQRKGKKNKVDFCGLDDRHGCAALQTAADGPLHGPARLPNCSAVLPMYCASREMKSPSHRSGTWNLHRILVVLSRRGTALRASLPSPAVLACDTAL